MPYTPQLEILREMRESSGLSQADMARHCGLHGQQSYQTAGAWERGEIIPSKARRRKFIGYLWDQLRLRDDMALFEKVWEQLVEAWDWEPITDAEWSEFTRLARPLQPSDLDQKPAEAETRHEGHLAATRLADERSKKPPFQAPAVISHFVGRKSELTELCDQISTRSQDRVYALVGMGGVGKSTLAIQVAHEVRQNFADGVLWASASTSSPLDIIDLWAQEYGCDFGRLSDLQSRAAALRSLLAPKNVLLILDDVTSVTQIQPLLPGGATCTVLLTTRSEDAAVALGAEIHRLTELALDEGISLLAALLGAARIDREAQAARSICRQLQCLPLALEIVGHLLQVRAQRQLADLTSYLEDVNNRLSLQISDRAVRTSFIASWEMLDVRHKATFASLGVFAGREFSTEAVAHVAELSNYLAQDHLFSLVALSLVREIGPDRFQQHPLLAGFAREQLGDPASHELRMAHYYQQFAHQQGRVGASLDGEWESIIAGMHAAYRLQEWPLVLAYGYSLSDSWFRQARFAQARDGYGWMNGAAIALANVAAQAFAHQKWGYSCLEQDDYREAADHLNRSIELYEALQDHVHMAESCYWLARLAIEQGTYADAQQHLETCHQVFEDHGDAAGLARTYYQQAMLAYHAGELAITQRLSNEAYAIQVTLDDRIDLLPTLRLLADVAIEHKDYNAADGYCEEALRLADDMQHRAELAAIQYLLAVVARRRRRLDRALEFCEQACTLFEMMGDKTFFALTLYERSKIDGLHRNFDTALRWSFQSLELFRELQDDFNQVYVLHQLGELSLVDERDGTEAAKANARDYWQRGFALAQQISHPLEQELQSCLER